MAAWWQTASTPSSARSTTLGVADVVAVGEIEHPDVVPVLAQRIDDVRADEAGAAGDEDHGRTVGALGPPHARRLRTVQEAVIASGAGTGSIGSVPDVILPVLDEAAAIPWVLERMPPDCDPIVVDNGSTDGSGDIARRLGARVVVEPVARVRRRLLRRSEGGPVPTSCASWTATDRSIPATCGACSAPSRAGRPTSSSGLARARASRTRASPTRS